MGVVYKAYDPDLDRTLALKVAGPTLRAWLKAQPRRPREILDVFLEAGKGLAAAHRAGLVRRDFEPDNVILGDDGRVRVVDFGLARTAIHDAGGGATSTPSELEVTSDGHAASSAPKPAPRSWSEVPMAL